MSRDTILMAHGGGGELSKRLIEEHILPRLANPLLDPLTDGAILDVPAGRLCVTTDASVVQPLFFPGGDIGRLTVCGTVNDLAMMGAKPLALTLALVIEEGLGFAELDRVLDSIAATAREAGVVVAAGDTKVVERRRGDGLVIGTAGVGLVRPGLELGTPRCQAGDRILVSGRIAEHGLAILAARGELGLSTSIVSDVAPLAELASALCELGPALRFLRDPTRGGLAGVLVDIAEGSGASVELEEARIPLANSVRHACELLGLDPLAVANEGKLVAVVDADHADEALAICQRFPVARHAALVGHLSGSQPALVELVTSSGGRRIVQRPYGEDLPRIC